MSESEPAPQWLRDKLLAEFMRPEHAPLSEHGVDHAGNPECVKCPVPAFVVLTPEEIVERQADVVWAELNNE